MLKELPEEFLNEEKIEIGYEPTSELLLVDITVFLTAIHGCFEAINNKIKRERIKTLLASQEWYLHHEHPKTGRRVLSETEIVEHQHEITLAKMLVNVDYDVLFAPKGMFNRNDKRFDVFLIREHVMLRADLKSISSKNPATIAKRIKGGSEQASRVVVHICSDIEKRMLIDGLRGGVERSALIEVLLFYNNKFYRLPKELISSKKIYQIIQ